MWMRQTHRWTSVVFTLTVAANFGVMAVREPPMWVSLLPLAPLAVMFLTGVVLFARPYLRRGATE